MVDRGRGIGALRTSYRDFPGGQPKKKKKKKKTNHQTLTSMVPAINIILYTYDFAKSRSSVKCSYHKYTNKQKGHEEAFEGMGVFMA